MTQAIKTQETARNSNDKYAPLMEKIRKFSETIPERELEKIPTDLSENLDHYIYGAPKKSEDKD